MTGSRIGQGCRTLVLTGGIGSGKSYISKIFAALGVPVYDADSRTKSLYDTDAGLAVALKELLGDALYMDGRLDRQYMAGRIFSDRGLLSKVEAVVFPYVIRDFHRWKQEWESRVSFVIMESAIYLEKECLQGIADKVVTVVAPEEIRVKRAMAREPVSREQVLARMRNQCTDKQRVALSDFVIVSDYSQPLLPQIEEIIGKMN